MLINHIAVVGSLHQEMILLNMKNNERVLNGKVAIPKTKGIIYTSNQAH